MGCVIAAAKDLMTEKHKCTMKPLQILRYESEGVNLDIAGRNSTEDINVFYEIDYDCILGTGASGPVRLCTSRQTQTQFALKRLCKLQIKSEKLGLLRAEIAIMTELDHPNILRLIEYFETDDEVYLILELCRGGELLDHLHRQINHQYDEASACQLIYTMLSAISYCHTKGIMHCDLKLENFLFETNDYKSELKLIDFGLSQHFKPNEILHRAVGTPYYVSPEVIAGNYTAKCDIWSLGVIAYMLLSGVPPFFGPDDNGTIQAVREGKWRFPDSLFKAVSPAAKSFISMCLSRQTSLRPSAAVAIKHKWFEILKNPDGSRDILKSKEFFQPDVKKNIHSIGSIAPLSTSRQNSSSLSLDNSLDSDVSTALNRDGLPHLHPSSQKMPPYLACQSPVRTMEILYNDSLSTHPPE